MGASAEPPLIYARLHQTVRVDGPRVIPLAVGEDSRCPQGVACAWAGRVRLSVRVLTGHGPRTMELTLGHPVPVADGLLELARVTPERDVRAAVAAPRYRFGFRFADGI